MQLRIFLISDMPTGLCTERRSYKDTIGQWTYTWHISWKQCIDVYRL